MRLLMEIGTFDLYKYVDQYYIYKYIVVNLLD